DRYLFLESLISARDHLIISYPSYSFREKAEVFPSTVLSELIHYVDGAFQFGPRSFQDARIYAHPFHPHASGYFHGDPHPIQGFNRRHFERAQALARPSAAARRFVAGVSVDGTAADPTMDVRRLERALRNPARSYLQERMGIYIHEAELLSPDEAAGLSPLLLYRWRDQVLEGKEDTERHVLEQSSNLPLGPLRRAAFQVLEEEQESCLEKAKGFGISPQDIWTVSLSAHCEAPIQQDARHWVFPAIELPSNEKVVGDILDVSSRGILSLGSDSLEALVKDWHRIVLVAELNQRYDLGWKTDFLSLKDGKARAICLEDPASDLSRLVQHVHDVTTHCTLLYPNWIETFLKMNIEEGLSRIQCTLEETRYGAGPARELLWLLAEGGEGMLQEKYTEWAKRARQIWRLPLASAFARVSKGWLE
ncbi:MAG: exodeoxyribonuclease V subunit gamma, partial [Chlamydiia bacterium]|nr:exodeoxyribonuclease V subunit gamma [Chlamydiia bacterium]